MILKKYLSIVAALGFLFQIVYYFHRNDIWLFITMWTPALTVFLLPEARAQVIPLLKKISVKWFLVALMFSIIPYIISFLIHLSMGLGSWNEAILGKSPEGIPEALLSLVLSIVLGSLITTAIATIGEEIGWRGFAQSALAKKYGLFFGVLALGIIWGLWHIPVNFIRYEGFGNVYVNTLIMFPLEVIFASYVIAWIRIKSDALWPCAFFHGVNNTISDIPFFISDSPETKQNIDLFSYLIFSLIFMYLIWKRSKKDSKLTPILE